MDQNEIKNKIKEICWDSNNNWYDLNKLHRAYSRGELNNYIKSNNSQKILSLYLKNEIERRNLFKKDIDQVPGYETLFTIITGISQISGNPKFLTQLNNSDLANLKKEYFLLINKKNDSILESRIICYFVGDNEMEDDENTIITILNLDKLDIKMKEQYIEKKFKANCWYESWLH